MGYLITIIDEVWEGALAAIGSHLTIGLGGILFLGFPAAFWCGAYGYAVAAHAGISIGVSFAIGILLSAFAGAIYAFFYARMSNDSFAVITLASVLALQALITSWESLTNGPLGIAGVPRPGFAQTLPSLFVLEAVIVLAALAFESLLIHAPFGRSLRALRENKNALIAMGTSARSVGQLALIFAGLFTGIAGILTAMRIQFLDPSLGGLVLLAQILTISIIASAPKVLRLLVITAVVVLLPELLRFFALPDSILGYARDLLYGLMLIILIYYVTYNTAEKRYV